MKALNEFKAFVLRGNVVDLAVGIVVGAAFGTVVSAFVKDFITPLIAVPGRRPDFSALYFMVNGSKFMYGDFVNTVVSFLIIAAVIFFFVVRPVNTLMARRKHELPPDPTSRDCPYCLSSIPLKATRCAYCTSEVAPGVVAVAARETLSEA
jgi:large conductance mechanosensitive channel